MRVCGNLVAVKIAIGKPISRYLFKSSKFRKNGIMFSLVRAFGVADLNSESVPFFQTRQLSISVPG